MRTSPSVEKWLEPASVMALAIAFLGALASCPLAAGAAPSIVAASSGYRRPSDSSDARRWVPTLAETGAPREEWRPGPLTLRPSAFQTMNSDRIEHRELRIAAGQPIEKRAVASLGAEYADVRGAAPWISYHGRRAVAMAESKPAPRVALSGTVGVGELSLEQFQNRAYGISGSAVVGRARAVFAPADRTELRAEASEDFTYMGWLNRQDAPQLMKARNLFAEIESAALEGWQLRSNARAVFLGDSNQQAAFDHLAMREIFRGPFVFQLGAGGGWFRFQQSRPGYWNPPYFEVYGPRAAISKRFGDAWTVEGRFAYSVHREEGRPAAPEGTVEASVQYRTKAGWLARFNGFALDSEGGAFWRRDVAFNLDVPF